MITLKRFCLTLYAIALFHYPNAFYERYAEEMYQMARREVGQSRHPLRTTASLLWDVLRSLPRIYWDSAAPKSPARPIVFLVLFTGFLIYSSLSIQQMWRRSADTVPASNTALYSEIASPRRAAWYARNLAAQPKQEITSQSWLDGQRAFTVLYDGDGHALAGNATLNGSLPQPPHGVFETIRTRGEDRVTWQPQPGVRIALTGRPLRLGGFVLSGESLRFGETRSARHMRFDFFVWLAMAMLFVPSAAARISARRRIAAIP